MASIKKRVGGEGGSDDRQGAESITWDTAFALLAHYYGWTAYYIEYELPLCDVWRYLDQVVNVEKIFTPQIKTGQSIDPLAATHLLEKQGLKRRR